MSTIAQQFGMTEALEILGVKAINEGTSTGNNHFSNGEIIESYSPVDGQLIGKVKTTTAEDYEKVMKRYEKYREDPEIFKYKKSLKMKSNLKLNYKITIEEYNNKLKKQKNRCAICNKHRNKFKRNLAVDHCHTTGKIRDLLCSICNTRLGYYEKSDIDKLKKYINKHRKDVN